MPIKYVHMFSVYIVFSYIVAPSGPGRPQRPMVCFAGDSTSRKILSYGVCLGKPLINLFNHAVLQLHNEIVGEKNFLARFRNQQVICAINSEALYANLNVDMPRHTLAVRFRPDSGLLEKEVGYDLMRYLYDWGFYDRAMEWNELMSIPELLKLIDIAVKKHNVTCDAQLNIQRKQA